MNTVSRLVSVSSKFAFAAVVAASLVACGGSDPAPAKSGTNVTITTTGKDPAAAAAATAVLTQGASYTFSSLPELGFKAAAATLYFQPTSDPSQVPFILTSDGHQPVIGTMTYGSCIFAPSKPPTDNVDLSGLLGTNVYVRVDPCTVTLSTSGKTMDGSSSTTTSTLILGNSASDGKTKVAVTVAIDGSVTVNGTKVGTVTAATGVSGS
jgi:hypothetical protein